MTLPNRVYLIQRLEKPAKSGIFGDNPFAFGGGLRNGGLSEDAMALLRRILAFDYMGSAEFEFGAVPKALQTLAKAAVDRKVVAKTITVDTVPVYVLAPADYMDYVEAVIRADYEGGPESPRLKQGTRFRDAIKIAKGDDVRFPTRVCGWLELDNGFMYFTDREMFEGVAALFEVEV
jgi:hypothetical protein